MSHNSPDVGQDLYTFIDPGTEVQFEHPIMEKLDRIIALLEAQEKAACIHLNTSDDADGNRGCNDCGTILWMARQEP